MMNGNQYAGDKYALKYRAVVIGASAGGSAALEQILPALPADYRLPVILVQHLHPQQDGPSLVYRLDYCALHFKEAEEKEAILPGYIYFAPPNYHLLVEDDFTFGLSVDEKVNFTRPSIDVLFESAAEAYGKRLVGIVLSGGNHDGAAGLQAIQRRGGLVVVQDPDTAEVAFMPRAALNAVKADYIFSPAEIAAWLPGLNLVATDGVSTF